MSRLVGAVIYVSGLLLVLTTRFVQTGTVTPGTGMIYVLGVYTGATILRWYFSDRASKPKRKRSAPLVIDHVLFFESVNRWLGFFFTLAAGCAGVAILTSLMIAYGDSLPLEQKAAYAYFLLCQLVPVLAALMITTGIIYIRAAYQMIDRKKNCYGQ